MRNWSGEHLNSVKFLLQGERYHFCFVIFMKVLSSLMQIPVGILSVNIKMSLWPFDDREASLNNLVPGTTWGREKLVCFSECLLIITEGIFFQYFEKQVHFCFYLIHFHFPINVTRQYFEYSWILVKYFRKYIPLIDSDLVTRYLFVLISCKISCLHTF